MEYPKEVIKEIAELINSGMDCYLNVETMEVESLFRDTYLTYTADEIEEFEGEIRAKIESWSKVICIHPPTSGTSFKFMEGFIEECIPDNTRLKVYLLEVLHKRKPFQHFNHIIHQSEYRQKWFEYKKTELEKYVNEKLAYLIPDKFSFEDIDPYPNF